MSRPAEKEANGNIVNLFITTQVKVKLRDAIRTENLQNQHRQMMN